MAATRRVEIFHDPDSTAERGAMSPQFSYDLMGGFSPDQSLQPNQFSRGSIILNPSTSTPSGRSPLKPLRRPSNSPPKAPHGLNTNISLPPPEASPFTTDSPLKQPCAAMYHPIASHQPLKPIFTTFSSTAPIDKENPHPAYYNDNFAEFPNPYYGHKAPLKRTSNCPHTQQHRPAKKGRCEESCGSDSSDLEKMPLAPDDGKKPPYSYAELIGMSIVRAPGRKLTLSHIYKWISDQFSHYRLEDTGWQNSIRHNLSLNKAFIKQERPKDDPGKGNYWAIEPGMESQILKDKPMRRPTSSSGPSTKGSSLLSSDTSVWSSQPAPPATAPPKAVSKAPKRGQEVIEPSSDATIPASDEASPDGEAGENEEPVDMPPPASRLPLSSPMQHMHSSPPVVNPMSLRDYTPSSESDHALPSNTSRSRKRKMAMMDDSGYFSSLDSSALRPLANPKLPDHKSDRPRIKRGRAEEEIARIRSSSHDSSPSKTKSILKQPTPSLLSSSPLRHFDSSLMLPPLTPAVKFKLPPKPPASISPNTNLRNHRNKIRELVGSPMKNTGLFSDDVSFSPAFNIVEDNVFEDDCSTFNIFTDADEETCCRPASTSPIKRSARRPRIDRAARTSNVLADITGAGLNSRASPSVLKIPNFDSPLRRKAQNLSSAFTSNDDKFAKEDLFGIEVLEDDEPDDFGGLDILQGFQKIGGNQNRPPPKACSRPPLGVRSHTELL